MKPLRILLLGFGHVARRLAAILGPERQRYPKLNHFDCRFIAILTRHHGHVINEGGIDLSGLLSTDPAKNPMQRSEARATQPNTTELIDHLDYDVLVDLTTLSIEEEGQPAMGFVRRVLQRGKHVVTANKGPAAFAGKELLALARQNNCQFLCESAVMDGAPLINMAGSCLKGTRITAFSGILNSTTNFVLNQMEQGVTMDEALQLAREKGFAEADPRYDLDGWDAAAKIAVLTNLLMKGSITPLQVKRDSIAALDAQVIEAAHKENKTLKLVCSSSLQNGHIEACVTLQALPRQHLFAAVTGSGSIIRLETDLMGPLLITQEAPTLNDTAYGVLNDLMSIAGGDQ